MEETLTHIAITFAILSIIGGGFTLLIRILSEKWPWESEELIQCKKEIKRKVKASELMEILDPVFKCDTPRSLQVVSKYRHDLDFTDLKIKITRLEGQVAKLEREKQELRKALNEAGVFDTALNKEKSKKTKKKKSKK